MIEQVLRLHPAGIVITTTPAELFEIPSRLLAESGVPVVAIGRDPLPGLACDRVVHSVAWKTRKLAEFVASRGYRDVAYLAVGPRRICARASADLRHALRGVGVDLPESKVIEIPGTSGFLDPPNPYIDSEAEMAERLRGGFRCAVLICGHDYPAVGALRAILKAGIRVPQEMAVVSELRTAVEGVSPMKLTTVEVHRDVQGQVAAEALLKRIAGYDGPPDVHHVPCEIVEGETT